MKTTNKYIGIELEDMSLLCFECADGKAGEGIEAVAYPDGYTCEECGDSITATGDREGI
jgi:hypothetical protein